MDGFGYHLYANGDIYQGNFLKGNKYGYGEFISKNSTNNESKHIYGFWKKNRLFSGTSITIKKNDQNIFTIKEIFYNGNLVKTNTNNSLKNQNAELKEFGEEAKEYLIDVAKEEEKEEIHKLN